MLETVADGNVEIDGGTAAEIRQELAQEVVEPTGHGKPAPEKPAGEAAAAGDGADGAAGAPGKKKKPLQARIDEITAERYAADRRAAKAEAEAAELRAKLEGRRTTGDAGDVRADRAAGGEEDAASSAPFLGVSLRAKVFPSYAEMLATNPELNQEDYFDARADWRHARQDGQARQARESVAQSQEFEATSAAFRERMAPALEADPKFYEKIDPILVDTPARSSLPAGHPDRFKFANYIADLCMRSEHPLEMMQWLSADGSKELRRLGTLNPEKVLREFLKKELSIRPVDADTGSSTAQPDDDEAEEVPARPVSTASRSEAAPPVRPVRGSSQSTAVEVDGNDDDDDDTFYRKEHAKQQKQLAARRR